MYKPMIALTGLMFLVTATFAQSAAVSSVRKSVEAAALAADQSDVVPLDDLLHPEFRIAMNRLFGSQDLVLMSKTAYLEKIRSKEFAGTPRTLVMTDVQVKGANAAVTAVFKGSTMSFHSYLTLVQNAGGQWWVVQDVPVLDLQQVCSAGKGTMAFAGSLDEGGGSISGQLPTKLHCSCSGRMFFSLRLPYRRTLRKKHVAHVQVKYVLAKRSVEAELDKGSA